ncbi:MAG: hypothetical protein AAF456_15225 [Planctomycetota bacterium]
MISKAFAMTSEDRQTLRCATCGTAVVYEGSRTCSRCFTPLELSRSVSLSENAGRYVTVLGQSGSGKTVFLGMLLDLLSRGHGELKGVPNGSFSVSVQQQTISALENQRFPQKTPSEADQWNWVHCEVQADRRGAKTADIITPDLAGEAIALEFEDPGVYPTIRNALRVSEGVIILFDSEKVRDNGRNEDLFGITATTYLASLHLEDQRRRFRKLGLPVAMVFTKSDRCPAAADDPKKFASEFMPGMVRVCRQKFANFQFFAASVAGSSSTRVQPNGTSVQVPLHIQPAGVVEPVAWIMKKLARRRR